MAFNISGHTLKRGFLEVIAGRPLSGGGDYLKDHPIKATFFKIITVGRYSKLAAAEIKQKSEGLAECSKSTSTAIINKQKDAITGDYECKDVEIFAQDQGQRHSSKFTIKQPHNSQTIHIIDQATGLEVDRIENISINDFKRAMLIQHIAKDLDDNNPVSDLTGLNCTGIDLSGLDLDRTLLGTSALKAAAASVSPSKPAVSLVGAKVAKGDDPSSKQPYCSIAGLKIRDIKVDMILEDLAKLNADLDGFDASGQNLSGINLEGRKFHDANLEGSDLTGAHLKNADMTGAKLAGAKCIKTDFTSANLTRVTTNATTFTGSIIREAIGAAAAIFTAANNNVTQELALTTQELDDAITKGSKDFSGVTLSPVETSGSKFDLSARKLQSLITSDSLSGFKFQKAQLAKSDFSGAQLRDANCEEADLSEIVVDGSTSMDGAKLNKAKLKNVDLQKIYISNATELKGTDLEGSKLNNSWIKALMHHNPTPAAGQAQPGQKNELINLRGVNLENQDLTGLDLRIFDLTGANLKGAKLDHAFLNETGLAAALKTMDRDASGVLTLIKIKLIGTQGRYLNLQKLDMSKLILKEATLEYCNLTDANLANSTLSEVTLDDCILSGADLTNTFFDSTDILKTLMNSIIGEGSMRVFSLFEQGWYRLTYETALKYLLNPVRYNNDPNIYSLDEASRRELSLNILVQLTTPSLNATNFTFDQTHPLFKQLYKSDGSLDYEKICPPQQTNNAASSSSSKDSASQTATQPDSPEVAHIKTKLADACPPSGKGFTPDQKTLFHRARAASWAVQFAGELLDQQKKLEHAQSKKQLSDSLAAGRITQQHHEEEVKKLQDAEKARQARFDSENTKERLYRSDKKTGQRLTKDLMEFTFDTVFKEFQSERKSHNKIYNFDDAEIQEVRNFFLDPKYHW